MSKEFYEYSNWFRNWRIHFSSKTSSKIIIDFYEEILKNEYSDIDYWYSIGIEAQNLRLLCFNKINWIELTVDTKYWTNQQINILFTILTNNFEFYQEGFEISYNDYVSKKSELYTHLLTICNEENFTNNIQDVNFIKLNKNLCIEQLKLIKERVEKFKNTLLNNNFGNTYKISDYEKIHQMLTEIINGK